LWQFHYGSVVVFIEGCRVRDGGFNRKKNAERRVFSFSKIRRLKKAGTLIFRNSPLKNCVVEPKPFASPSPLPSPPNILRPDVMARVSSRRRRAMPSLASSLLLLAAAEMMGGRRVILPARAFVAPPPARGRRRRRRAEEADRVVVELAVSPSPPDDDGGVRLA
jgi:hypothetical protein